MGLLATLLEPRAHSPDPADDFWWRPSVARAASGVSVTPETALKISAVWACVRLIADSLATAPLIVYRRRDNGDRERATDMPLYGLLRTAPNAYQTAFEFIEQLTVCALLRGNGYALIQPGDRGLVDQLLPLHPDRVMVETGPDHLPRYRVLAPDGSQTILPREQVFHLRGLSTDGMTGLSVIQYARESMGLALATESYGARFFSQNASPSGVLEHPGRLSEQAAARLRKDWAAMHAGLDNAHSTAILEEGMRWHQVGLSAEDAQLLGIREFQVEDIARWFGVPLHMIQQTSKATSWGTGLEQMSLGFVIYTLLPWARRWEQAISRDLIQATNVYFAEFLFEGFMRGDQESRNRAYATARQWGWLSVNDIRRLENMNAIEGGDVYLQPLNMVPAGATPMTAPAVRRGHYERLVREAARRVVRKEMAVLSKAARRCAADGEAWADAVAEFYASHGQYIAEVLLIPRDDAESYSARQRSAVLAGGLAAVEDSEYERVEELVSLALGSEECHA